MLKRSRYYRRRFLLWSVVLAVLMTACSQPETQEFQTVEFLADSVGRTLKYNIALPAGYASSEERYPVLYLLHGLMGNYTQWAQSAPGYAVDLDLILVMPDGGNSWYVNWSRSADGQKNNWEDYLIQDLIPHVDSRFRTIASREGRAVTGLSMGGYGAVVLGLRNPDMFCAVGSHSGALNFAASNRRRLASGEETWVIWEDRLSDKPNPRIAINGFSSQSERTPHGDIFLTLEDCTSYDPFKLILEISLENLPHIYLDCGLDDSLLTASQDFARLLQEHKVPFVYAQSSGEHTWEYWNREVGQAIAVQYNILRRGRTPDKLERE
jgi:S-formylglutathione hydrolase FrmB